MAQTNPFPKDLADFADVASYFEALATISRDAAVWATSERDRQHHEDCAEVWARAAKVLDEAVRIATSAPSQPSAPSQSSAPPEQPRLVVDNTAAE